MGFDDITYQSSHELVALSGNLEQSIRVNLIKHEYVEYVRKKSTIQVTKKANVTLGKVKARFIKCDHHLRVKHKFVIRQTYLKTSKTTT